VLLREGPDKATPDSYLRAVDEQWQRREAFLKQNPELGLGKEDLERAHRLTKEEYVTQAREQFIRKYREKAAIGLAAIGSDDGRRALRETAARQGDPLQDFVRPILTKPIGK
jgi:geranylgeranyl pyrophosphate synthase